MRIFTQFIILYENKPLPSAEKLCPMIWKSRNFDSEGDYYYYYNDMNGKWTILELINRENTNDKDIFSVYTYRTERLYESGTYNVSNLSTFLDFYKERVYDGIGLLKNIQNLAVTSISIETSDTNIYKNFLNSTYFLLSHVYGVIVNVGGGLNTSEFRDKFLFE